MIKSASIYGGPNAFCRPTHCFLILVYPFVKSDWTHLWGYYVAFLQNVPDAFHLVSFGPLVPLWSLAVEQHFYLIWPLLVYFLPRKWLVPCMIALLLGNSGTARGVHSSVLKTGADLRPHSLSPGRNGRGSFGRALLTALQTLADYSLGTTHHGARSNHLCIARKPTSGFRRDAKHANL